MRRTLEQARDLSFALNRGPADDADLGHRCPGALILSMAKVAAALHMAGCAEHISSSSCQSRSSAFTLVQRTAATASPAGIRAIPGPTP